MSVPTKTPANPDAYDPFRFCRIPWIYPWGPAFAGIRNPEPSPEEIKMLAEYGLDRTGKSLKADRMELPSGNHVGLT